jgi:hypothetical protein
LAFAIFANKIANFGTDRKPPRAFAPGFEFPEQLEALFVPPNDGVRLDNNQKLVANYSKNGKIKSRKDGLGYEAKVV